MKKRFLQIIARVLVLCLISDPLTAAAFAIGPGPIRLRAVATDFTATAVNPPPLFEPPHRLQVAYAIRRAVADLRQHENGFVVGITLAINGAAMAFTGGYIVHGSPGRGIALGAAGMAALAAAANFLIPRPNRQPTHDAAVENPPSAEPTESLTLFSAVPLAAALGLRSALSHWLPGAGPALAGIGFFPFGLRRLRMQPLRSPADDETRIPEDRIDRWGQAIIDQFNANSGRRKIVDMGTFDGEFLRNWRARYPSDLIIGYELKYWPVRFPLWLQLVPDGVVFRDAAETGVTSDSVDRVTINHPDPNRIHQTLPGMAREAYRILRPGGSISLALEDIAASADPVRRKMFANTRAEVLMITRHAGFKIVIDGPLPLIDPTYPSTKFMVLLPTRYIEAKKPVLQAPDRGFALLRLGLAMGALGAPVLIPIAWARPSWAAAFAITAAVTGIWQARRLRNRSLSTIPVGILRAA
jgi:hypothetical protein